MAKYVYPAIFAKEGEQYSVRFPDIPNCMTQGENMRDAFENAEDALCLVLYHMEQRGETAPAVSDPIGLALSKNEFISLVDCDTIEYEKFYKSRSIKKTLTIPEWLNDMAIRENVNFSNVLQKALMEQLSVNK